jgi:plastocyanin
MLSLVRATVPSPTKQARAGLTGRAKEDSADRADGYGSRMRSTRARTVPLVVLAVAVLAAACGSSSGSGVSSRISSAGSVPPALSSAASSAVSGAAEGHVVEIDVADSGLAFVTTSATASAGPVVIRSENPQSIGHDIALKGNGVDETGDTVSDGGVSTITIADLRPGTYTFYCSVPGHEQAGMKGTLTVS